MLKTYLWVYWLFGIGLGQIHHRKTVLRTKKTTNEFLFFIRAKGISPHPQIPPCF